MRDVVVAILYIASTACQWSLSPNDFPPPSRVRRSFHAWRDSDPLVTINHHPVMAARQAEGREAGPTAGIIDSQSVKATQSGGIRG